jgi:hypothetical protein
MGCAYVFVDIYLFDFRVQHYGELALECAMTYYKYGCALFDKLQSEADPLGDTATPWESNRGSLSSEASKGKGFLHHFTSSEGTHLQKTVRLWINMSCLRML